jgi:hypothetical protein
MYAMKVVASSVFRKMIFPHNGKLVTIDQLTYHDPQAQLHPDNVVSSLGGDQTTTPINDLFPRVYKDSILLGAYYGPPLTVTAPSSSHVCMVSSNHGPTDQTHNPLLTFHTCILHASTRYVTTTSTLSLHGQVPFLFPPPGIISTPGHGYPHPA